MIVELRFIRNTVGVAAHWWVNPNSTNLNPLRLENALDWLWQQVARWKCELKVGLYDDTLRVTENTTFFDNGNYVILFSGSPKDVVLQLRPYMRMMEGR